MSTTYSESIIPGARIFPGEPLTVKRQPHSPFHYSLGREFWIHFEGFDALPLVCTSPRTYCPGFVCPFADCAGEIFDKNLKLDELEMFTGNLGLCEDKTYTILRTRCEQTPVSTVGDIPHNCVLEVKDVLTGEVIISRMLLEVRDSEGELVQ